MASDGGVLQVLAGLGGGPQPVVGGGGVASGSRVTDVCLESLDNLGPVPGLHVCALTQAQHVHVYLASPPFYHPFSLISVPTRVLQNLNLMEMSRHKSSCP